IHSTSGNLVELLPDGRGEYFLAVAFVRAPGRSPGKGDWNESRYETWGATLGRMHALSKDYAPPDPTWQRPEWDAPIMLETERFLPPSESITVERFRELMKHLRSLPRDRDSYGLIHQDAHGGNLFVDETGRITFFDFDDCCYSWFVNDIAIVLFYALLDPDIVVPAPEQFLFPFLRGYARENRLDPAWLVEIPHFCKLREIDLYAVVHRSFDDVAHIDNPWIANYMRGRKQRIERGAPYVEVDWSAFSLPGR
ncbi:MAG: phosphotransferase enzyme family protein, partial [Rudaea sp.]